MDIREDEHKNLQQVSKVLNTLSLTKGQVEAILGRKCT